MFDRRDAGLYRDRAHLGGPRRFDILWGVADHGDRFGAPDPTLGARFADGEAGESAAGPGHLTGSAEAEVSRQAGAFELAPADLSQFAGYQAEQDSVSGKPFEERLHG